MGAGRALMTARLCFAWSVAGCAFFRSWLVEENRFAFHFSPQSVASFAANALVSTCQRESGTPLVIETRWLPLRGVVTIGAGSNTAGIGKLRPVNVVVALFTFGGSRFEIHVHHAGFKIRWLMTIDAGCTPMCAHQSEAGLRVIKFLQIFPGQG